MKPRLVWILLLLILAHCKTSQKFQSDVKITNGEELEESDYPAVVLLMMPNDKLCTGVFINDFQALTAAHCLLGETQAKMVRPRVLSTIFGFRTLAKSETLAYHPDYKTSSDTNKDIGIISFPKKTSTSFFRISKEPPKAEDSITIIGFGYPIIERKTAFGRIQQSGYTQKRIGTNRIGKVGDGVIVFRSFLSSEDAKEAGEPIGSGSGFASGDSGGPVLNSAKELVGITSAGLPIFAGFDDLAAINNLAVDLTSLPIKNFLKDKIKK